MKGRPGGGKPSRFNLFSWLKGRFLWMIHGGSPGADYAWALTAAMIGVLLEILSGRVRAFSDFEVGGYYYGQRSLHSREYRAVIVDLDIFAPKRERSRYFPQSTSGSDLIEWKKVVHRWNDIRQTLLRLKVVKPERILLDLDVALRTEYVATPNHFYNPATIPVFAQNAYKQLIDTIIDIDEHTCPIAVGGDNIDDGFGRIDDRRLWFPDARMNRLVGSLVAPGPNIGPFDGTAFTKGKSKYPLPPITDLLANSLDDATYWWSRFGFSAIVREEERQAIDDRDFHGWSEYLIDYSTVNPVPQTPESAGGKAVILTHWENRNSEDSAVSPTGLVPGGFYQAAALGTRLGRLLCTFSSRTSELIFIFLINLVSGLVVVKGAQHIVKRKSLVKHHHINVVHFAVETAIGFAIFGGLILIGQSVQLTRIIIPGLPALVTMRFFDIVLVLSRVGWHMNHPSKDNEENSHPVNNPSGESEINPSDLKIDDETRVKEKVSS